MRKMPEATVFSGNWQEQGHRRSATAVKSSFPRLPAVSCHHGPHLPCHGVSVDVAANGTYLFTDHESALGQIQIM